MHLRINQNVLIINFHTVSVDIKQSLNQPECSNTIDFHTVSVDVKPGITESTRDVLIIDFHTVSQCGRKASLSQSKCSNNRFPYGFSVWT